MAKIPTPQFRYDPFTYLMKTQYYTATSLDGFIADANNGLDWLFQFGGGPVGDHVAFTKGVGALAMGSNTYEWMLKHHVYRDPASPAPWPYPEPTWVFSTRELRPVGGANVHFVRGDVRPVHAAMVAAAAERNVWIVGGGELAGQFHDHGLLDEIIVTIASVTLGAGAPLLPRLISTPPLRLTSAQAYGTGFVQLTYDVPPKEG